MATTNQYLIDFLATMKGDKVVVAALKKMQKAEQGVYSTTKKAAGANKSLGASMMGLAKRALMVAPIWMLMRSAIMLVTTTIREVIQANMDFQVQLARIKTVVSASSKSIESDMTNIRAVILDTAVSSTASLKDLAEAFYFLRTSNLSTEEAIAAFKPSVDLAIGTLNKLGETARTVAGIYATIGKRMGENMTLTEKFTKIADGLAYTYATQEVQMGELLQSYIKIAPYLGGLKESWTEIVTILGFLNTKQLKAGRTGRLLGRSILQIVKNSKQLAHIFGITYSKDEPIAFLAILKKINEAMKGGASTAGQREKLFKVFATRGQVPVSLLLNDFKEMEDAIKNAGENMDGFVEKMSKIMKKTVPAQLQRTKNILAAMANTFFSAAAGGGDFVDVLVEVNNSLQNTIQPLKDAGLLVGWLTDNILKLNQVYGMDSNQKEWANALKRTSIFVGGLSTLIDTLKNAKFMPFNLTSYDEYVEKQKEGDKLTKKRIDTQAKYNSLKAVTSKALMDNMKAEAIIQKSIISLMKQRGATELEIADYKINNVTEISKWMEDEESYSKNIALINDKINAQYSERIKGTKNLVAHHQKLHTIFGADSVEAAKLNYEIQRMLYGENDITRTLKAKLDLEQEILSSKQKQYQYTSDEATLMKVYTKYGEDVARNMAKVLTGQIKPENLEKKDLAAFKQFFPERQKAEEVRKFYEEDEGRGIKSVLDEQKRRERSKALSDARRLKRTYETPAVSPERISMELSKITLPQPMDVNVTAEVKVDVNREQLEADVTRIVNDAIRSPKNKKYIKDTMFDAEE